MKRTYVADIVPEPYDDDEMATLQPVARTLALISGEDPGNWRDHLPYAATIVHANARPGRTDFDPRDDLDPVERDHVEDSADDAYGPEVGIVNETNGFALRAPAHPAECDYVRVTDPMGREIAYWHRDEWMRDLEVMGAIVGAIARGPDAAG